MTPDMTEWRHLPDNERANVYYRMGMAAGERMNEVVPGDDVGRERAVRTCLGITAAAQALMAIPYEPGPNAETP